MNDNDKGEVLIDKTAFSVVSLESESDEQFFWWTKTPMERLNHLEYLRRVNYGIAATERLQRILDYSQ